MTRERSPLGISLLQHQGTAYVGVMGDGDSRCGLVRHLGQVGTLNALLGVVQRVEVSGRQRGNSFGTHHHSGELNDAEHLRDAIVDVTDQGANRGLFVAEGELAGGGGFEPHLVLEISDVDAIVVAEVPGLEVDVILGHSEQRQALGAGAGALGSREDEVHDVVVEVSIARGDEALDPGDVPGAVGLLNRLGATGADVGARVGLGEHHGAAPLVVDHVTRQLLLILGAKAIEHLGEGEAGGVHVYGGVRAEDQLRNGPT